MDTLAGGATNAQGFIDQVNSHKKVLLGDSARGLNIEMTLYLPRADWWVHVQVLYEYGI
jgi:hypothetical protein